jgi:predicted small secreted protein
MAMTLTEVGEWMGKHPYITGGSIVVGGLGILWLFGFFNKPAAASDTGQTNMAAAYYAAEAAQAAAGAQIQSISLQTTAATAQTKIAADAAVAINGANTGSAVLINQQNTGSANTINGQNVGRDVAVTGINAGSANTIAGFGRDVSLAGIGAQLQQTQINADAATTQIQSNNATAAQVAQIGATATTLGTALRTVVPFEQSLSGGGAGLLIPGIGQLNIGADLPANINDLIAQGFTSAQAAQVAGVSGTE